MPFGQDARLEAGPGSQLVLGGDLVADRRCTGCPARRPGTSTRRGTARCAARVPVFLGLRILSNVDTEDGYRPERGGVRVWLAADQGKRWYQAFVVPTGDGTYLTGTPWLAPRSGQAVSVRVAATAPEGRSIDQTIIDAYPVR